MEIPKQRRFGRRDWILKRETRPSSEPRPGETLLEYERRLLDRVFQEGAEGVTLSELRDRFPNILSRVSDALYENAVDRGWFLARPDAVRRQWIRLGGRVFYLAGVLVIAAIAWTHHALILLPLMLLGVLLLVGAKSMPRRTAKGAALMRRVRGFRTYIRTAEVYPARRATEETLFTRFLPYAIVFGLTDKWATAFADVVRAPAVAWYVSSHPLVVGDFGDAMNSFAVTAAGLTGSGSGVTGMGGFSRGFSGGGGGGGGGGGSW